MQVDAFYISDSRKERIKKALERYGYTEEDFEWTSTQDIAGSREDRPQGAAAVYLIYKPTGFRRMYSETSWEAEFEDDLRNQIFQPGS